MELGLEVEKGVLTYPRSPSPKVAADLLQGETMSGNLCRGYDKN